MSELIIGLESMAGLGPTPATFDEVVEAFCRDQDGLRARLARAAYRTAHPPESCNSNGVTDDGRHGGGQD